MSLLDRLAEGPRPLGPRTRIEAILGALDPAEREALQKALDSDVSAAWLSRVLREEGHKVSASTIRNYRSERRSKPDEE